MFEIKILVNDEPPSPQAQKVIDIWQSAVTELQKYLSSYPEPNDETRTLASMPMAVCASFYAPSAIDTGALQFVTQFSIELSRRMEAAMEHIERGPLQ